MNTALLIIQIVLSLALTTVILLQNQGTGLGSTFGGGESYHTKRGLEKVLMYATVGLIVAFVITSLALH